MSAVDGNPKGSITEPNYTAPFEDDEPLPPMAAQTPPPSSTHPATVTIALITEYSAIAASASPTDFAVLAKLRAPPANPSPHGRAPVDLVAVLDVSGSMARSKLSLVKKAMHFVIDTLSSSDRLSIVAFSTNARRVLNLCRMSDQGRIRASAAVDSLTAQSSTNIKAGIQMGIRVLQERRYNNPVAGVILLSDGKENVNRVSNISRRRDVIDPPMEYYQFLLPTITVMPVHTFGFGADHDPRVMHGIADASGGTFSFVEAEESIQDAFAVCIGGLFSVAAQQVEISLSVASSGVFISCVDSGRYGSRILDDGRAAVVDIGDLYADEERDFLVHVSVPVLKGEHDGTTTALLTTKCSYKDPMLLAEPICWEGVTVAIARPDMLSPEDQELNLIVDGQRNRMMVAESIKEAQAQAESSNFEEAIRVLTERRSALLDSASGRAGSHLTGWLDAELEELQKRMADLRVYRRSGRAYAFSGASSHLNQRAAGGAVAKTTREFQTRRNMRRSARSVHAGGDIDVGYQTQAMRDMVEKSQQYDREQNEKK